MKFTQVSPRSIVNNGKSTRKSPWASITLPTSARGKVLGIVTHGKVTKYFHGENARIVKDQVIEYIAGLS